MNEDVFHLGVKALIRNTSGEVLLFKVDSNRLTGWEDRHDYWDLPGGRVKKGDTVEETLKREFEEETGIKDLKVVRKLGMTLSPTRIALKDGIDVGWILAIYECEAEGLDNLRLSEENNDWQWVGGEELRMRLGFVYEEEMVEMIVND